MKKSKLSVTRLSSNAYILLTPDAVVHGTRKYVEAYLGHIGLPKGEARSLMNSLDMDDFEDDGPVGIAS